MGDHKEINEQRYKLCILAINSLKVTHCGKHKIKNYKNYSGIPRVKSTWVWVWWLVFTSHTNSAIHERKKWIKWTLLKFKCSPVKDSIQRIERQALLESIFKTHIWRNICMQNIQSTVKTPQSENKLPKLK